MRELILGMSVSLDGFVSGPDGEAKWIFSGDQEAIAWKVKNIWNASLQMNVAGYPTQQGAQCEQANRRCEYAPG
jgi:hypothetical protein